MTSQINVDQINPTNPLLPVNLTGPSVPTYNGVPLSLQGVTSSESKTSASNFLASKLRGLATDQIFANSARSAEYISIFSRFRANITRRFIQPFASTLGGPYTISSGIYSTLESDLQSFSSIGCRTIIVLTPSRSDNSDERRDSAWWANTSAKNAYVSCVADFALRVKGDNRIAAIAVINEPFNTAGGYGTSQQGTDQILEFQEQCIAAIRAVDPTRVCIVTCGWEGAPGGYNNMRPVNFDNVVYEFHFYQPFSITHSNVGIPAYTGVYPSTTLVDGETGNGVQYFSPTRANKDRMKADLQAPILFSKQYGLPMLVGEFGISRMNGPLVAPNWTQDAIEVFEEFGWSWCHYGFWFLPSPWDSMSLDNSSSSITFNNGTTSGLAALSSLTSGSTVGRTPIAVVSAALETNALFKTGLKPSAALVFVQEDFESTLGRLGGAGGSTITSSGTSAVLNSTTAPKSGTKHARFTNSSGSGSVTAAVMLQDVGSGKNCEEYWISADIALRTAITASSTLGLFEFSSNGEGSGNYIKLRNVAGTNNWQLEVYKGSDFNGRPFINVTGMTLTLNTYTNIKVSWLRSTGSGRIRVWQDRKLLVDINGIPTATNITDSMWRPIYGMLECNQVGMIVDFDNVKFSGAADMV